MGAGDAEFPRHGIGAGRGLAAVARQRQAQNDHEAAIELREFVETVRLARQAASRLVRQSQQPTEGMAEGRPLQRGRRHRLIRGG